MKTFSITMISVMAMSGLAFAQVKAGGSASAGATVKTGTAAGATTGAAGAAGGAAKAGTGAATGAAGGAAKAGTGAATGAAGAAGGTAKAGTGAAAGAAGGASVGATAGAGMKMEMPKPPAEIAAMMKSMGGGNVKCTGTFTGMGSEIPMKGTMSMKSDLDGWWVHDSYKATMVGPDKKPMTFKMEGYGTYDASAKKYRRVAVMNDGGMMVSSSDGPDASGHMTGMADTWGPHGQGMMKETMDMSDAKAGVKMTGEMSMDKGKTWTKVYEQTCKK